MPRKAQTDKTEEVKVDVPEAVEASEEISVQDESAEIMPEEAPEPEKEFKDDEEIILPEEKPETRSYRSNLLPEGIGGNNRIDVAVSERKDHCMQKKAYTHVTVSVEPKKRTQPSIKNIWSWQHL